MKAASNYLKLSVKSDTPIRAFDPVNLPPSSEAEKAGGFVTSWVFPFSGKAEGVKALAAAQELRAALRAAGGFDLESFQLATFLPNFLRGVPQLGHFARRSAETLELAEAS